MNTEQLSDVLALSPFAFTDWLRRRIVTIPADRHLDLSPNEPDSKNLYLKLANENQVKLNAELFGCNCGSSFDQTEFSRYFLDHHRFQSKTWLLANDSFNIYHSLITYESHGGFFYLENAWDFNRGIYKFSSSQEFITWIVPFYAHSHALDSNDIGVYQYPKPEALALSYYNYVQFAKCYPLTG